jgi:hypothetical protein
VEAALSRSAESDCESRSSNSEDSENASSNSERLKVEAAAAATGITYDFGASSVTKVHIGSMETTRPTLPRDMVEPLAQSRCWSPMQMKLLSSKIFFTAGLRMPPHLVLADILHKFQVQFNHLMLKAIIQISKFIWAVTSCGGHPTADVFAQHYELHHQHKKIHLEGCETTLAVQFGCIAFHPSGYGGRARLTPAIRNNWMSG